uniref:Uncharacterized protein n=1 Tax=Arion vulgaris TaxID=1028688 RepID=A0A0B7BKT3_9EUPU
MSVSVSMETQRLISVSLGKIAQSRSQRGGINLHKNLLVATVLHKARTAYMMESYTYQQNLQRQKLLEQYQAQQDDRLSTGQQIEVGELNKGEVLARDSNLGHPAATPTGGEETRSDVSSETTVSCAHEQMSVEDNEVVVVHDKENSPPAVDDRHIFPDTVQVTKLSQDSHLSAATQLSQEAQLAASSCEHNSLKQQTLTSGGTTCNVLKRRRDNPSASVPDSDHPLNKIARVHNSDRSQNVTPVLSSSSYTDYSSDCSAESHSVSESSHKSDTNQITNLVSIFHSGFSGLCVASNSDLQGSSYQSELAISNSQLYTRKIATKAG